MNKITDLNRIRDAALKAVDPGRAVRKFIDLETGEHGGSVKVSLLSLTGMRVIWNSLQKSGY